MRRSAATPWRRAIPGGFLQEALAFRHRPRPLPTRFVVLAQGRSGSTLLATLLDSHSMIRCEGELLELPRVGPVTFVENRARGGRHPVFGFHVKPYQLTKRQRVRDLPEFLQGFHGHGWAIVHLCRENVFNQAVSTFYARASGRYHFHARDGEARPEAIVLDPEALIEKMRQRADLLMAERRALEGLPHVGVGYERDLFDPDRRAAALGRVTDFLGLPLERLSSDLRKAVRRPMSAIVANFDEVAAAVRSTPFASHLPVEAG
jgi:LPS sulfotransferase NodH